VPHENEFLLRIRKAFGEVIERVRKTIKFLHETLFQFVEPLSTASKAPRTFVLGVKATVNSVEVMVNSVEARIELPVLSRQAFIDGVQYDGSFAQKGVARSLWGLRVTSFVFGFGLGH
jgi:hypothetical protein